MCFNYTHSIVEHWQIECLTVSPQYSKYHDIAHIDFCCINTCQLDTVRLDRRRNVYKARKTWNRFDSKGKFGPTGEFWQWSVGKLVELLLVESNWNCGELVGIGESCWAGWYGKQHGYCERFAKHCGWMVGGGCRPYGAHHDQRSVCTSWLAKNGKEYRCRVGTRAQESGLRGFIFGDLPCSHNGYWWWHMLLTACNDDDWSYMLLVRLNHG